MDHLAKIHLDRWKECLKINEGAKFERDVLKTNKDMHSATKSQDFTDVCMVVGGGGGASLYSHHTNICKISRLCRAMSSLASDITFKLGKFTNFNPLFSVVSMDIP